MKYRFFIIETDVPKGRRYRPSESVKLWGLRSRSSESMYGLGGYTSVAKAKSAIRRVNKGPQDIEVIDSSEMGE